MGIDKDTLNKVDGAVGTGGDADSIFVIAFDLSTGKSKIINISRDTMTEIGIYATNGSYIGEKKGADSSCLRLRRRKRYKLP